MCEIFSITIFVENFKRTMYELASQIRTNWSMESSQHVTFIKNVAIYAWTQVSTIESWWIKYIFGSCWNELWNNCSIMVMKLPHSLIRGVLIQSCSAGAKNFTKCVFYHVQFSGVIQNIAYDRAIFTLFVYVDYYQNNQFY